LGRDWVIALELNLTTGDREPSPEARRKTERPARVKLIFPSQFSAVDLRAAKDLGPTTDLEATVGVGEPALFRLSKL
jgi:hypothetical protein